jgi:hypothetical protein
MMMMMNKKETIKKEAGRVLIWCISPARAWIQDSLCPILSPNRAPA